MWGDYERGVSQPKAEQLFQFEKAGIDIDYVMHGVRHTERPSEAFSDGPRARRSRIVCSANPAASVAPDSRRRPRCRKKPAIINQVSATHKTA